MPCPHNEITIVQRSQRQSAVAAAAYQSGEKLFCEYDQQVKHYPKKRGMPRSRMAAHGCPTLGKAPTGPTPARLSCGRLWRAACSRNIV